MSTQQTKGDNTIYIGRSALVPANPRAVDNPDVKNLSALTTPKAIHRLKNASLKKNYTSKSRHYATFGLGLRQQMPLIAAHQ